jgi:hypothetical protein
MRIELTTALALLACAALVACSPSAPESTANSDSTSATSTSTDAATGVQEFDALAVEVGCGQCLFDMEGDGCDLAFRAGEQRWFADGVDLDSLGDPHAADGWCNAIRHAVVSGRVEDGRFVASKFELVADAK